MNVTTKFIRITAKDLYANLENVAMGNIDGEEVPDLLGLLGNYVTINRGLLTIAIFIYTNTQSINCKPLTASIIQTTRNPNSVPVYLCLG